MGQHGGRSTSSWVMEMAGVPNIMHTKAKGLLRMAATPKSHFSTPTDPYWRCFGEDGAGKSERGDAGGGL